MNIDFTNFKIHPRIEFLRDEFSLSDSPRAIDTENYWFCLKPEKRNEYMQKNKIYANAEREETPKDSPKYTFSHRNSSPTNNLVHGYARKSGETFKNDDILKNDDKISKSTDSPKIFSKSFLLEKRIRKPKIKGKKFIIEIDE